LTHAVYIRTPTGFVLWGLLFYIEYDIIVNEFRSLKGDNRMKRVAGIIILLALIGAFVFSPSINDSIKESQKTEEVQKSAQKTNGTTTDTQTEKTPSTFGWAFSFLVLVGILITIIVMTYRDKRGTGASVPWGDILSQPVFIAVLGVVILNALASLFIYPTWRWFWDHQTLFWGTNIALVIFVHFTTKKEPYAKFVSGGIGLLILMGFATTLYREHIDVWWTKKTQKNTQTKSLASSLTYRVPVEVAKKVICECESGCRQFEVDKDGKFITDTNGNKIPYKNRGIPQKNIPPSSAFGKYQFLEVHREPAKKLDWDLNTEEGQEQYFEYLYGKEGFGPWDFDEEYGGGRACWGPKLAALGYGAQESPELLGVVDVPSSEWSDVVVNTYLSKIGWGRLDTSKGGVCEVMMDGDSQKVFDIKGNHPEITPRSVQFKCTEKGAIVRVRRVPNT